MSQHRSFCQTAEGPKSFNTKAEELIYDNQPDEENDHQTAGQGSS